MAAFTSHRKKRDLPAADTLEQEKKSLMERKEGPKRKRAKANPAIISRANASLKENRGQAQPPRAMLFPEVLCEEQQTESVGVQLLLAALCFVFFSCFRASAKPAVLALTHAKIFTSPVPSGARSKMATLIIKDGKIAAVGTLNVEVPLALKSSTQGPSKSIPAIFDPINADGAHEISAVNATSIPPTVRLLTRTSYTQATAVSPFQRHIPLRALRNHEVLTVPTVAV